MKHETALREQLSKPWSYWACGPCRLVWLMPVEESDGSPRYCVKCRRTTAVGISLAVDHPMPVALVEELIEALAYRHPHPAKTDREDVRAAPKGGSR